jgi:hypothetical protein
MAYKLAQFSGVIRLRDGIGIPEDDMNRDYQEYLAWKSEGNEPEPADPIPTIIDMPSLQEKVDALELVVGMLLEADDV